MPLVPRLLPTGPLVLPAVDLWDIDADGTIRAIRSAWQEDDRIVTAIYADPDAWLDDVKRHWRASAPRSDPRWSLTHRVVPEGWTGWLALIQRTHGRLPHWEIRHSGGRVQGALVSVTSRLTLHLASLEAVTTAGLDELIPGQADPAAVLEELRRLAGVLGIAGHLPLSLTGLACREFCAQLPAMVTTPGYASQLDWQQRAVSGPRVEAVAPGIYPDACQYDLNGAYVQAMVDTAVPISPYGVWTEQYYGDGIYEVEFEQTRRDLPPLLRADGGEFSYIGRGIYTSVELDVLRDVGTFTVVKGFLFRAMAPLLADYARACWDRRRFVSKQVEPVAERMLKQLPLRLFGLTLSKGEGEVIVPMDGAAYEAGAIYLADGIATMPTERPNGWRFPAIGAFVLAAGRVLLWRAMCQAVEQGGRVLSAYTDALVIQGAELPLGIGLGELKVVAGPADCLIANAQQVAVGRQVRIAGMRCPQDALGSLRRAARGTRVQMDYESPTTALEALSDGLVVGVAQRRHATIGPPLPPVSERMRSRRRQRYGAPIDYLAMEEEERANADD